MKGYSFLSLARQALSGNKGWPVAWRSPEPRKNDDVVIIGAGGQAVVAAVDDDGVVLYCGHRRLVTELLFNDASPPQSYEIIAELRLDDERAVPYARAFKLISPTVDP